MNRCPLTYLPSTSRYSIEGLRKLARGLNNLADLPYSAEQQREEALIRATKMSVQGVQPKLSAILKVSEGAFVLVDANGKFILKPQSLLFPYLPENEDLTMRLAELVGFEVPLHGLLYSIDGSMTYFIKRFDRQGKIKLACEDFAQLASKTRDTKYQFSMEKIIPIIESHCTFPLVEKVKIFKLTLFSFLVGNEDLHLKNFSLIRRKGKVELSPLYDLVNSTIALKQPQEEFALTIQGKRSHLTKEILVDYYGRDRLQLNEATINQISLQFRNTLHLWRELILVSFLPQSLQDAYLKLLEHRQNVLFGKS